MVRDSVERWHYIPKIPNRYFDADNLPMQEARGPVGDALNSIPQTLAQVSEIDKFYFITSLANEREILAKFVFML